MQNFKPKLLYKAFNPGVKNRLIFSLTVLLLFSNSCASLQRLSEEGPGKDKFSRAYSQEFASFHPKVNSALQEYAQKNKGNSFRIARLGNDGVIIRGYFKSGQYQERFSTEIMVKPSGRGKTLLEINFAVNTPSVSTDSLEKASQEIFRIVEKGTGVSLPK